MILDLRFQIFDLFIQVTIYFPVYKTCIITAECGEIQLSTNSGNRFNSYNF